jgi:hypothetical protein
MLGLLRIQKKVTLRAGRLCSEAFFLKACGFGPPGDGPVRISYSTCSPRLIPSPPILAVLATGEWQGCSLTRQAAPKPPLLPTFPSPGPLLR